MSKFYVCCIARLEGRYIKEFVDHYLGLGFDKIIVCDNNHDGEDDLGVLDEYVKNGQVIIEDYRNQVKAQNKAYNDVYRKYGGECDWMLFCDVDEFLVLEHDKTIQDYIRRFPSDWQAILINWDCRNANGKVEYENKPLFKRFTESIPTDKCVQYQNIAEDMHIKSIIRGGLPFVKFYSNPHLPSNPLICYNASGVRCSNSPWQPVDFKMARIVHFVTKSLQEWTENKMKRGVGDRTYELFLKTYAKRFWSYNEKTEEMVVWLKKHGYDWI